MADSVGLALQSVLDTLSPHERLAFVLHDMFDVPFDQIGSMVGRSATAARQLASRARRHVQGAAAPTPDRDLARQRQVVAAFFAAAHRNDRWAALRGTGFTVANGRIAEIDCFLDPNRLARLDLTLLDGAP